MQELRATTKHFSQLRTVLGGFLLAAVWSSVTADRALADGWMYRPSFYSHQVPPELWRAHPRPRSRSAYRPAYVGTGPGFAVRGGYRINRMFLRSGNSTDITIYREDFFQETP